MRIVFFVLIILCSCSSKKDIILMQNATLNSDYSFEYKNIKIQPDDILRIKISQIYGYLYKNTGVSIQRPGNILNYQIEGY